MKKLLCNIMVRSWETKVSVSWGNHITLLWNKNHLDFSRVLQLVRLCVFSHFKWFFNSQFELKIWKEQGQVRKLLRSSWEAEITSWSLKLWAFWTHSFSARLHLQSSVSVPVSTESQIWLSVCLPAQREVHHLSLDGAAVGSADTYKKQHASQK